jgi:hypothetical protein
MLDSVWADMCNCLPCLCATVAVDVFAVHMSCTACELICLRSNQKWWYAVWGWRPHVRMRLQAGPCCRCCALLRVLFCLAVLFANLAAVYSR